MKDKKFELYQENWEIWQPLWDQYESTIEGQPAIQKYLFRYPGERQNKYEYRARLSTWHGLMDAITQRWVQTFNRANKEVTVPDLLKEIKDNFDYAGNSINKMRELWFLDTSTYGVLWGMVDEPMWPNRPDKPSEADKKKANIRPYGTTYTQPHVLKWRKDKYGNLTLVRIQTDDVHLEDEKEYPIYRDYVIASFDEELASGYRDFWLKDKKEPVVINSFKIGLVNDKGEPILPWVRSACLESRKYNGYARSPIDGISDLGVSLFNYDSQCVVLFAKVGFCFLVMPEKGDTKHIGLNTIIEVPKDGIMPDYVTPKAVLFEQYANVSERIIKQIFTTAGVKNRANIVDTRKSGAAIKAEDIETEDKVSLIAENVRRFEYEMWKLIGYSLKKPELLGKIKLDYPENYDIRSLEAELADLQAISLTDNKEWKLQQFESIVRRKVRNQEDQDRIIKEAKTSISMQFAGLGANVIKMLPDLLKMGIVNIPKLVKEINPEYRDRTDAECIKWAAENMKMWKDAQDEFNMSNEVNNTEAIQFDEETN